MYIFTLAFILPLLYISSCRVIQNRMAYHITKFDLSYYGIRKPIINNKRKDRYIP